MQNQIPKNWHQVKLRNLLRSGVILEIQDGNHGEKHPKQSDYVKNGERVPFVMANDITNGGINFRDCNYISKEQGDKLRIGFSRTGDVLLTHKGNLGLTAIVPEMPFEYAMLTPQVTYYRINKNKINNKFLKYSFRSPLFQRELLDISPQSTRPYVGITAQKELTIYYTDNLKEQQRVASVLSVFDDKVEVNNKIAKTLEEMGQAIFKEWFSSNSGKEFSFYDLAVYVNGGVFGKILGERKDGLPLIKIAELNRGITENTEWISKKVENKYYIRDGDLLFSWSGTIELTIWDNGKAILNQHLFNVLPKSGFSKGFLFFALNSRLRYFKQIAGSKATTMGHIKKEHLQEQKISIPPGVNLSIFDIIYKKMVQLKLENQNLSSIRDLLLPKLMRGEIRI